MGTQNVYGVWMFWVAVFRFSCLPPCIWVRIALWTKWEPWWEKLPDWFSGILGILIGLEVSSPNLMNALGNLWGRPCVHSGASCLSADWCSYLVCSCTWPVSSWKCQPANTDTCSTGCSLFSHSISSPLTQESSQSISHARFRLMCEQGLLLFRKALAV